MAKILILTFLLFAGACYAAPGRIAGGELTTIEYFPSIVQVESQAFVTGTWSQNCAANILNTMNVLSAAHCFAGGLYDPSRRRIRAGATFRHTGGIVSSVLREFNYPTYGILENDGDITVVRLIEPLVYSPVVQQATIIAQGFTFPDNLPVVHAGWGTPSNPGGVFPNQLQQVNIFTINNDLCRERYATEHLTVTENMICAGILNVGGKDACVGDAGAPLYYENIVIGVASWRIRCADAFFPGVSTAVSPYTDWIVSVAVS